nr:hypothetical protein B0A51_07999 [Rachicladosporium sp. CCFEE 5018]
MSDAQHFFDLARSQFNSLTTDIEHHFDLVASQLRQYLPSETASFIRAPPPPRLPPPTTLQLLTRWVDKHRAVSAAIAAFALTGSVSAALYVQQRRSHRKRRARKSPSGARTDVVVLAGATGSPLASALAVDLERRGFVVYVLVGSTEEEGYIRSLSRADLLPLPVALGDSYQAQEQIARFRGLLEREHVAFEGALPHHLDFRGLVLVPDTGSCVAEHIADIGSEEWNDVLNAKVLNTVATTQLFLPALIAQKAKVLLLTPVITPALSPPGHAVENTIHAALSAFAATLSAEMVEQGTGVGVTHFKLGNIDIPSVTAKQRRDGQVAPRLRATPLRRLNDAVFDALTTSRPSRTWRVGRGSLAYDFIGAVAPAGVVGWMLSLGRGNHEDAGFASDRMGSSQGSLTWEKIEGEGSERASP